MEQQEQQREILTSCRECIFAHYIGNIQYGCHQDRIRLYREQGAVVEDGFDGSRTHFVVKDRLCTLARTTDWQFGKLPMEEAKRKARNEIRLRLEVIVLTESADKAEVTLNSLSLQGLPPHQVTLVCQNGSVAKEVALRVRQKVFPFNWRVERVLPVEGAALSREACLDIALAKLSCPYYSVFDAGHSIPTSFVSSLDEALNDRLERFVLLTPNAAGQGLTVMALLHKLCEGNSKLGLEEGGSVRTVLEKARYAADKSGTEGQIKPVEEVCPSLA